MPARKARQSSRSWGPKVGIASSVIALALSGGTRALPRVESLAIDEREKEEELKNTPSDDMIVVGAFIKNAFEEVRAYLAPYKGRDLAHIRVFVSDDEDVMHPTKKGIAIGTEDLPKLAELVDALLRASERLHAAHSEQVEREEVHPATH
jgi:Transcriptional Coactivator p15 (PC4)